MSFEAPHLFTTFSREGGGEDEDEDEIVEKFVPIIVIVAIIISSLLLLCVLSLLLIQSVSKREEFLIQFCPNFPLIKSKKLNEWWWCRSNATFFIVINHVLTNLRATKR